MFFEGEIYNKKELGFEGTDAEVALAAYRKWGVSSFAKLRGAFAFVVENDDELILVRDQFGSVPCYYYNNGELYFGVSVKEMLDAGVPRKLSKEGLCTFLVFGCLMHPRTMIDGVRCVLPGEYIVFNKWNRAEKHVQYWRPDFRIKRWNLGELQEGVNELLRKSVARHISCGGDPAAFLSGGIDSSAIVALMRMILPDESLRTYCVAHENPKYDERFWAHKVAERNLTNHKDLVLTADVISKNLSLAVESYDQPSVDGLNFWFGFKLLKEAGEKILLSGEAGDELFFSAMGKQVLAHRWDRFFRWMPRKIGSLVESLAPNEKFRKLGQLMGCRVPTFFITRRILSENQVKKLLRPEFLDLSGVQNPFVDIDRKETDVYNYISWMDVRNFGADMYQRDGFQTARAHGLVMRMPLYDVDLVELLYSAPGPIKYSLTDPKFLLVNACGDGIPTECVKRPKMGFSIPFKEYFQGALRDTLEAFLQGRTLLFNPCAIQELGRQFYAGKIYWSNVWIPFMAENWCRINHISL